MLVIKDWKFSEWDIQYLNTKFDITDEDSLKQAILEMIDTYMEM